VFSDVINGANVRMVQRRSCLRLTLESGECLRVSSDLIWQELQGHEAMQPDVLRLVHHAHPAPAEFLDDAVVRDGLADQ